MKEEERFQVSVDLDFITSEGELRLSLTDYEALKTWATRREYIPIPFFSTTSHREYPPDADAQGVILRTFRGHTNWVTSVAFAPDGRTALSGAEDKTLILWDFQTGRNIRTFQGHTRAVTSVAFAPDGHTALSGSNDQTLILWDIQTGRNIRTFEGHTNWVTSVAFAPDGHTALSGAIDKTLILWDIQTGRKIRTFEGHTDGVTSVAFASDESTWGGKVQKYFKEKVLSGSYDGTLIWRTLDNEVAFQAIHAPEGQRAVIDLRTKRFVYLEPEAWRVAYAERVNPVTGKIRRVDPRQAYDPPAG